VKVMAKDLIRTRHQITKFYGLKSQLQGISLRISVSPHQLLDRAFSPLRLWRAHSVCEAKFPDTG